MDVANAVAVDAISQQRLSLVAPALRTRVTSMLTALASKGVPTRVTCGLRSVAEQAADFAQGRTILPGRIITQARPGYSYHQFGMAVDLVPMTLPHGQPDWNESHPDWQLIVTEGERATQ